MIEVQEMTKRYGPFTAVNRISFSVERGEVVGFIGPNGAGKTSTMRVLTGFLPATEGRVQVAGHDVFDSPKKVKAKVGYLPETPPLYTELTVGHYLRFVSEIRGVTRSKRLSRIGEVMEKVGLSGWEDRILGSLSKGYRQRVGIAQALVHDPEVLILDEPTSGLDPVQTQGVRRLIHDLSGDRTIVLSTHILSEVEALCSRVIMIDRGVLVADGSLPEVRQAAGGDHYRLRLESRHGPLEDLGMVAAAVGGLPGVDQVAPRADGSLSVQASAGHPGDALLSLVADRGWRIVELRTHRPSLEEAFLALVGREQ